MARSRDWHRRALLMERSRDELGHFRPKLPSSLASPRPSLGAPARHARPRNHLGASAPYPWLHSGEPLQLACARALQVVRLHAFAY
ncbi:hypothetical protein PIB30_083971, partial [Stylosanthes scabra]|nr:hypothetical protein [Stylosanthes scabra]